VHTLGHAGGEKMYKHLKEIYDNISRAICNAFYHNCPSCILMRKVPGKLETVKPIISETYLPWQIYPQLVVKDLLDADARVHVIPCPVSVRKQTYSATPVVMQEVLLVRTAPVNHCSLLILTSFT